MFRALVREIEAYRTRAVSSMRELRLRDDRGSHGRAWELFCRDWLKALTRQGPARETVRVYEDVWLLSEAPDVVLTLCGLVRLDSGIDLVARLASPSRARLYDPGKHPAAPTSSLVAVQCKFRSPGKLGRAKRLPWKELSTFTGLCSISGPWARALIMTNAPGLGARVPRSRATGEATDTRKTLLADRYVTLAFGSFEATTLEHWARMTGLGPGTRLDQPTLPRGEFSRARPQNTDLPRGGSGARPRRPTLRFPGQGHALGHASESTSDDETS